VYIKPLIQINIKKQGIPSTVHSWLTFELFSNMIIAVEFNRYEIVTCYFSIVYIYLFRMAV